MKKEWKKNGQEVFLEGDTDFETRAELQVVHASDTESSDSESEAEGEEY